MGNENDDSSGMRGAEDDSFVQSNRDVQQPDRPKPRPIDPPPSFGKFLYTQNPFYLISCGLIIYGLQSLAISSGDLLSKSVAMTGGIALYTLLMSAICIAVVRVAKVWDDARSIFLIVLIGLVALTTGFDELCIRDNSIARGFAALAIGTTVVAIETVIFACRIRFTMWYRLTLYALLAVFIVSPVVLGNAVAERNDLLAHWGSLLFSIAIAGGLLLLIPAVRLGGDSVINHGTPWRWPLYPLAAFFVLVVLAGIRAHAIWISFGFLGVSGKFEPFLLMPLLASVALLVAEYGIAQKQTAIQYSVLLAVPLLLICGITNNTMTWLPIRDELRYSAGSGWTASLVTVLMLYAVMSLRRVRYAAFGIPATLLLASLTAPLPTFAVDLGLRGWMLMTAAGLILFVLTLRHWKQDWFWTALAGAAAVTIVMTSETYGYEGEGWIVAMIFATVAMMAIGALFATPLADVLRGLAAAGLVLATMFCFFRLGTNTSSLWRLWPWLLILVATIGLTYGIFVQRTGWLILATLQMLIFLALISWSSFRGGKLRQVNWPISSGLVCLAVGLAITTGKTGLYQRLGQSRSQLPNLDDFRAGF